MAASKELDDILSNALEDFDDEEEEEEHISSKSSALALKEKMSAAAEKAVAVTEKSAKEQKKDETLDNITSLMSGLEGGEDFQKMLNEALKGMGGISGDGGDGSSGDGDAAIDANIAKTLQMLSEAGHAGGGAAGAEPAAMQAMGEDVMKKMMSDFEKMGESGDFQSVVDGMMKQLLSKQIMYEPIKAICEKYPEWLAENQSKLSEEDYTRYGKQYQYVQRICAVYETTPDNHERLVELMQDMQEYGKPPAEIIKELAPGLQFGSDGMPIMPNMGPGMPGGAMMPEIPGMEGQQCVLQ